jgi:molecular chaperone DnaK (HSP70)
MSKDIIDIFCDCLVNLNIKFTIRQSKISNVYNVNVYKKEEFKKLYKFIGLKDQKLKKEIEIYIKMQPQKFKDIYFCQCGKEIRKESKLCPTCDKIRQRKVKDRPSKEELILMVKESSLEAVGRKYGVTGKSIKKWLKV